MTDTLTPMPTDEARDLLDQFAAGELDAKTRARVALAIDNDAELARELSALEGTLAALRALERPEPPMDMVARVRRGLAEERRSQAQHGGAVEPPADIPHPAFLEPSSSPPAGRGWMIGVQAFAGIAAVCAIVIGVVVGSPTTTGDTSAAGIAQATIASAALIAPGLDADEVRAMATDAGMRPVDDSPLSFEGDSRAARKFVVALRVAAARGETSVRGFVPDGDVVRISVDVAGQ